MRKRVILFIILLFTIFLFLFSLYQKNLIFPSKDIVFVPLDSRPVNTQNVLLLTNMWGKNLILPPSDSLDYYKKPANFQKLYSWLKTSVSHKRNYAIVISLQQYLNGGLIASRQLENYTQYKEKLDLLYSFLKKNKGKNVIIFSVIPRVTPSKEEYSDKLKRFSYLTDKIDLFHIPDDIKEKEKIVSSIPHQILDEYINLFEINEKINKALIDWTKKGIITTFVIGIDDTQDYSISNMVARRLQEYAEEQGISDRVYILHGADEIGMEITAKLANQYYRQSPAFKVIYDVENPEKTFLPYEGADLKKIVEEKIKFIGGKIDKNGDCLLYIHTRQNPGIKREVEKYKNNGQIFGIADVAYTNRADKELVEILLNLDPLKILYSGWNTPSNSIGAVISEMSLKRIMDKELISFSQMEKAIKSFIAFSFIRYADDFAYQAVVRNEMYKWAKLNNMSVYDIELQTASKELAVKMGPILEKLKQKYIGREVKIGRARVKIKNIEVKVKYPWNRMFEIEISPEITLYNKR